MRSRLFPCLGVFLLTSSFAQTTIGVGGGAPTPAIGQQFVDAFNSNGFNLLVALPPAGAVSKYGSTGLIQQFQGATNSTSLFGLIKADTSNASNVYQVLAPMFAYYNSIGPGTAGYPANNTFPCPAALPTGNSCQWQSFSSSYALFVYRQPFADGSQNFSTRDPFFTKWMSFSGITGLGPATSAETAVTSIYGTKATVQFFLQGAIFNITSGTLNGRLVAVKEPVYDLYNLNSGASGSLGLPIAEELALPNGMRRQTFEGGAIDYDPTTGVAVIRPPIGNLAVQPIGALHMTLGDILPALVTVYAKDGSVLTDRIVSWNTSNGRVVQIQASGLSATLKAIGAGTATITVTAEGKTSLPLTISVTSPCCQIGEGAPTAALQQAFQDAVARNKLSIQLPAASPAARAGSGYIQKLLGADAAATPYLVAVPDGSIAGYVVSGIVLSQFLALGGPGGSLGYPLSDATAGGRQTFQQGTLAGNPVQLVTETILAKWGSFGYETGAAGSPTAAASSFLTFRATTGIMQSFQNAVIVTASTGPLAGQTFFVTGLALAGYASSGGPGGDLGAPIGDEFSVNGRRHQDFEGGYIDYAPGDQMANLVKNPRQPLVTAAPTSVLSGGRVRLAVGGFSNGTTVRVSQTGQADFLVTVLNGSYAWDAHVPAAAASGIVVIRAADVNGSAFAIGSYSIRNASSAPLTITVAGGDQQIGAPGAQLAQPLAVIVKDQFGNPVPGQPVTFVASPGGRITPAAAATDAKGQASALLRLPMSEGVALATAQAGHQVVTFSARSAAFSLTNFPALTQSVSETLGNGKDTIQQKGALLASVAAIVRYHQLRGELPQPNGLADPLTLNQFLKSGGFVSFHGGEQTVNLWRVGGFVAGDIDVSVESADLNTVRDLVAAGSPVLLALSVGRLGSHFVVATGITSDGSLMIADPNPALGRGTVQPTLIGAVRLLPRVPQPPGFLVVSTASTAVSSVAGECGHTLSFPDAAAVAGATPSSAPGTLYFRPCDGATGLYELDVQADATFNDLETAAVPVTVGDSGPASFKAVRVNTQWSLSSLDLTLAAGGVVNAASFSGDFAPGGLITIYGAGFVQSGSTPSVQINGTDAFVLAAFPFQVNAQIPLDAPPGPATLSVASGAGAAQQQIMLRDVAPAIFSIGAEQAAITNQDNQLNTPSNPASRGTTIVIYATGFGAVGSAGGLNPARTPVIAVIGSTEIPAAFAGLTPGSTGLYQANVVLPATLPPGLFLPLYLKQGAMASNTVTVAVQ